MVEVAFYLVSEAVALRSGVIDSRYRIADGRFVLDNKDLSYIRFSPEEYINGLEGVEMVSKQDAMILIKENNYARGRVNKIAHDKGVEEPEIEQEQQEGETSSSSSSDNAGDEQEAQGDENTSLSSSEDTEEEVAQDEQSDSSESESDGSSSSSSDDTDDNSETTEDSNE